MLNRFQFEVNKILNNFREFVKEEEIPKSVLIALCSLLFVLAVIFYSVSSPPPISKEETKYTYTPSDSTPSHCVLSSTGPNDCNQGSENSKPEAKNNENEYSGFVKDKRDLNAQEGVWRGTNAVVFLTMIATALAAVGLYMIFETLRATRATFRTTNEMLTQARYVTEQSFKATDQARWATEAANRAAEAAENAEKAYVSVDIEIEFIGKEFEFEGSEKSEFVFHAFVTNHGKTPATDIEWRIDPTYVNGLTKKRADGPLRAEDREIGYHGQAEVSGGIAVCGAGVSQRFHVSTFPSKNFGYKLVDPNIEQNYFRAEWVFIDIFGVRWKGIIDFSIRVSGTEKFSMSRGNIASNAGVYGEAGMKDLISRLQSVGIKIHRRSLKRDE